MALVVVAVGIAMVLSLTFLTTATSATRSAVVLVDHSRARYIAESGLASIVAYIEQSTNWRTSRPQGAWLADQPFGGGTYSVSVVDGIDTNNDGVVDGDGDFANNSADPVTLTVTGKYGLASFVLKAAWAPHIGSVVVANESVELHNKAIVDSYNDAAGPYGGSNVGQLAAVDCNSVGNKQNINLHDSSIVNGNVLLPVAADPSLAFTNQSTSHITGTIGSLGSDGIDLPSPDVPVLSTNKGDLSYSSGTIIVSSDLWCNSLVLSGTAKLLIKNNVNIVIDSNFDMKDTSSLALDNPTYGNLSQSGTKTSSVANIQIASPITTTQSLQVASVLAYVSNANGHRIRMAIYTDNSGEPGTLIAQTAAQQVSDSSNHWEEAALSTPVTLAAGTYWLALCFDNSGSEYHSDNSGSMRYRSNAAVGSGFYASWGTSDSSLSRALNICVAANVAGQGGSVTIYSSGTNKIESNAQVNVNTQQPSRVTFYDLDETDKGEFHIQGNSIVYGTFVTTADLFHVQDNVVFNGTAQVSDLKVENQAQMHIDSSGGAASPGLLVDNTIETKGTTVIDGYNGTLNMACNSVGSAVILVKDQSQLLGNAFAGPGGAGGNTDVHIGSGAVMTGTASNLTAAIDMTLPATPSLAGGATDLKINNTTYTLNSDRRIKTLQISNSGVLNVDGQVKVTIEADSVIQNFGKIVLTPGSKLTIYTNNKLDIKDDAQVNYNGDPASLVIYDSNTAFNFHARAKMAATLWAPNVDYHIKDNAQWFGSLYVRKLHVEKFGQLHMAQQPHGTVRWMTQP